MNMYEEWQKVKTLEQDAHAAWNRAQEQLKSLHIKNMTQLAIVSLESDRVVCMPGRNLPLLPPDTRIVSFPSLHTIDDTKMSTQVLATEKHVFGCDLGVQYIRTTPRTTKERFGYTKIRNFPYVYEIEAQDWLRKNMASEEDHWRFHMTSELVWLRQEQFDAVVAANKSKRRKKN